LERSAIKKLSGVRGSLELPKSTTFRILDLMMVLGVDWMISFFFFGFVDVTSSDDSDIRRLLFRKKEKEKKVRSVV
jgi:hypothetical protein